MLDDTKILSIIQDELSSANGASDNGINVTDLEESLNYYLGNPLGNEIEGRSQIVSTDVADAIEWIMPQIMKSFTQNNEVVIFDPVHAGDETQAELESEYVYEVLMKQNDGFIILHQFVKDALMQRNGILKTYYANRTETKAVDYTGITDEQLESLLQNDDVELLAKSSSVDQDLTAQAEQEAMMQFQQQMQQMQQQIQQMQQQGQEIPPEAMQQMQNAQPPQVEPVMVHDVKVGVSRVRGQIYVDPVPPEEFRINSQHNSINPDNARFTAHVVPKTISDLLQEYDELEFKDLKDLVGDSEEYQREYRFNAQDESYIYDTDSPDPSQQIVEVAECYLRMDVDETGIAKLMKVTVAGASTPTKILHMEEIDSMPWVATTAFLMSHKFQGISITDRLKEIQKHKTTLWRNMLDNIYLQNNQRHIVVEGQVNMDDLLISRPGGIIRAKRADAIVPLQTPQLNNDVYTMMEYLDRVRAGRSGVDADGNATPQNIGDRVGSEGVDRLMNAKEELVGLIIRVVAETGVKPLCTKIRDLTIKHVDSVVDFRFRGVWYKIMPSAWPDRTTCTVRVGTGSGNHLAQLQALSQVLMLHEKFQMAPQLGLSNTQRLYNSVDDFCKFSGLNGANRYFIDPSSPEGQQVARQNAQAAEQQQQMQMQEVQMNQAAAQAQIQLAQAELQKAEAQQQNVQMKAQNDGMKNQIEYQKQQYEAEIKMLEQRLKEAEALANTAMNDAKLNLEREKLSTQAALKLTEIETNAKAQLNKEYKENKADVA